MSGHDMCERIYHQPPEATPEREQAWAEWRDDYVAGLATQWTEQGAAYDAVLESGACVLAEFADLESHPWAPLGHTLLSHMLNPPDPAQGVLEGQARLDFLSEIRTVETATDSERTAALAYHLGISVDAAEHVRNEIHKDIASPNPGRVALYRHYDAAGELLYVGISADPIKRADQHQARSPWFRFVADTQTEWFSSRREAEAAEREAIRSELPIFNQAMNKANRDAAVKYLFAALTKENVA